MANVEPHIASAPVRVAMADDHPLVLEIFAQVIDSIDGYEVVVTALNGRELILRLGATEPVDIAVVDIYMPVMGGVETMEWLRANHPGTRVLALSFDRSPDVMNEALRAGACGFIPKEVTRLELRDALESTHRRGSYHNDALLREHAAAGETGPTKDLTTTLTATQKMVLDCVCADDEPTWEQVADRMDKSPATIDTHRANLFKALQVKSKPGLVSYGRVHGFGKGRYWAQD